MAVGETIRVTGTVQGVGFRPFVWQLAKRFKLRGQVCNDAEGVLIEAWGTEQALNEFIASLQLQPPPLAVIKNITRAPINQPCTSQGFTINTSGKGQAATAVAADAATCTECLKEMSDPSNRRYGYPFINCTHCGPRFSIIKAIPYDRQNTSMAAFKQCPACQAEYDDPANRRFHAQPNACAECGPTLWLEGENFNGDKNTINAEAITQAANLLKQGFVVAIKGLGGFHLACDATNEKAVALLRQRKHRYRKPLALMAKDLQQINLFAHINDSAEECLKSNAAPIVLLNKRSGGDFLAPSVAPGQTQLGFMLPYTGLHYQLMAALEQPIVLTSGNISDEPQCIDNAIAKKQLAPMADYFLLHNRDIINRIDDSVIQISKGQQQTLRRARGLAPKPFALPAGFSRDHSVLALGADLKNTFCLAHKGEALVSQYMGDLEDHQTQQDYRHNLALYKKLYQFAPQAIAVDKHPNYLSRHYGEQLASELNLPLIPVQHHHAHVAAAMLEAGLAKSCAPVLGIALDGLGFGENGEYWGGEFLLTSYQQCQRVGRFKPVAMPGGNAAMKEPWRNTLAQLLAGQPWQQWQTEFSDSELIHTLTQKPVKLLAQMANKNINSPLSSSAGRLFDAVAAALGICRDSLSYEGEAAISLQALALTYQVPAYKTCLSEQSSMPFTGPLMDSNNEGLLEINWQNYWRHLLTQLANNLPKNQIAWEFHTTLSQTLAKAVKILAKRHVFSGIVLTGGVFQNSLLVELLMAELQALEMPVYLPRAFPCNDAGVALGQAAVALAAEENSAP